MDMFSPTNNRGGISFDFETYYRDRAFTDFVATCNTSETVGP